MLAGTLRHVRVIYRNVPDRLLTLTHASKVPARLNIISRLLLLLPLLQIVISAHKELALDEKSYHVRFGSTCVTGYGPLMRTADYASFDEFYAALQAQWQALWVEVFSADPAGAGSCRCISTPQEQLQGQQGGQLRISALSLGPCMKKCCTQPAARLACFLSAVSMSTLHLPLYVKCARWLTESCWPLPCCALLCSAAGAGHPRACRLPLPDAAAAVAAVLDAAGGGPDGLGAGLERTRLVQHRSAPGWHAAPRGGRAAGGRFICKQRVESAVLFVWNSACCSSACASLASH